MRRHSRIAPIVRRGVVAVGVLSVGLAGVTSAVAVPRQHVGAASKVDSHEHPTIDTYQGWDGVEYMFPFGSLDTATYGQVIKVPADKANLWRFSFFMSNYQNSGSLVARGEVYEWDGTKATGSALWESTPRTLSYRGDAYHRESFNPHGVPVQAGAKYVIFVSISKDYEDSTTGYQLKWAYRSDEPYKAGHFVYMNNAGDESAWTNVAWDTFGGSPDAAFKAHLR